MAIFLAAASGAAADCDAGHVHLTGAWGKAQFNTEIADTMRARQKGLMYRTSLPRSHSMLFVFGRQAPRSFWMKNTFVPLDILFFDAQGALVNIRHDAVPGDLTPLSSTGPAQFVLEINAGLSKRLKLDETTVLSHPSVKNSSLTQICR